MLRTLDLFSGVGGLTRALHGLAKPVAYCERDPVPYAALERLMADDRLPTAPICTDVIGLDQAWLDSHGIAGVDAIIGGFPCVGFSTCGKRQGFDNDQSALFTHILRLADLTRAPLLFLENVPGVLNHGMDAVAHELSVVRGYQLRWCVVSASDVGAPQKRARWYCLAVKPDFAHVWDLPARFEPHAWAEADLDFIQPAVPKSREALNSHAMMGNSVVPDAVRWAFLQLVGAFRPVDVLDTPAGFKLEAVDAAIDRKRAGGRTWPRWGWLQAGGTHGGEAYPVPLPQAFRTLLKLTLEMDPLAVPPAKPPSPMLRLDPLTVPFVRTSFSTPLHSARSAPVYITSRTARCLDSQVRMWSKTPDHLRGGTTSPALVEWLMGYPQGWTR